MFNWLYREYIEGADSAYAAETRASAWAYWCLQVFFGQRLNLTQRLEAQRTQLAFIKFERDLAQERLAELANAR